MTTPDKVYVVTRADHMQHLGFVFVYFFVDEDRAIKYCDDLNASIPDAEYYVDCVRNGGTVWERAS